MYFLLFISWSQSLKFSWFLCNSCALFTGFRFHGTLSWKTHWKPRNQTREPDNSRWERAVATFPGRQDLKLSLLQPKSLPSLFKNSPANSSVSPSPEIEGLFFYDFPLLYEDEMVKKRVLIEEAKKKDTWYGFRDKTGISLKFSHMRGSVKGSAKISVKGNSSYFCERKFKLDTLKWEILNNRECLQKMYKFIRDN